MKELLTLIIQNIENFEKSMKFRKGQKPFYDAIIKSLKKDKTTMFVKGPTGMGKTFLEAVLAAALIGNSDIKILLLTSKITLLQQIQREFKRFVGFLKTGLFGGGFKNYHEQVTIMTYASYQRQSESFIKQFKVLLLDEGHKGLGKKTKEQLEKQKEFSILIGFTASDEYSKEKSLTKFLVNKAHELSIKEAVEIGMLSNIKVMIASVDIEIDSQQKGESKGDYEERISSEIIREGGNIATARLYKRVFEKRNLRGIALVLTTLQGRDLVEECAKEGIKAELIHSGLKRDEREEMFTRFRNHEFSLLIGMGIIKEGFDDPGVSVAITTYQVSSIVDMTQFPGRAERIDEQNPDKVAYIVNLAYKAKKQLFYSDVLNGKSELRQKKKRTKKLDMISSSEMQEAIARKPDSYITNVAVSEEEVISLIRDLREDFLSFSELNTEVKKYNLTKKSEYTEEQKIHDNWPAEPWKMFRSEWVNLYDFLGKFFTYTKLQKDVKEKRVGSSIEYKELQKKNPKWPSNPNTYYSEWVSWSVFLQKKSKFLSLDCLRSEVQKKNFEYIKEYKREQKKHHNWPAEPHITYKEEWISYEDLLGSSFKASGHSKEMISLANLEKAVRVMKISTITEYQKEYPNHHNWPSNPDNYYDDWNSWLNLFGLEKPKVGWMSPYQIRIRKDVKCSKITINRFVEPYRKTNPEYFDFFKSGNGIGEFFHPNLVTKIIKNFKKIR